MMVRLDSMKGSNATGEATLTPTSDGGLKVVITAKNMVPNSPHAQHFHGDVAGRNFTCPSPSADKNGDGFISIEEGVPSYGPVLHHTSSISHRHRALIDDHDRHPVTAAVTWC